MKLPTLTNLIFFAFLFVEGFCQVGASSVLNNISISSPTAASLGKYGDIPVNYHTGIPNISIPIYQVKEGPISLPINLSYHASGIKVMEPASWVGAGWSLNAGGVITRSVQGAPDERYTSTTYDQSKGYFSDYGYHNYETGNCTVADPNIDFAGFFCGKGFAEGRKDGEPDLFFYNFGGYSGKFYFNDDRTPVFVPSQDIKVKYDYIESGSIRSFTLITPDGTKYHFGKTLNPTDVDPVETTDPYTSGGGFITGTTISSWYLNKIETADAFFSITLLYEAEEYGVFTLSTYPVLMGGPEDPWGIKCVKNIIHGVRLKAIQYSNGDIQFKPGEMRQDLSTALQDISSDAGTNTAKTLGEIQVNTVGGTCLKFIFDYEYFEDNQTNLTQRIPYNITTDKKRLKLKQVQQKSCDNGIVIPPYAFTYYNYAVHRRLSCGQDHWGYSNGIGTNQGLLPSYTINNYNSIIQADRDSRWPQMLGGTLQEIIYPTGGSSKMDFEANRTWISYTEYIPNSLGSYGIGFDGNQNGQTFNISFTQQVHKIKIVNKPGGGSASVFTPAGSVIAQDGETKEFILHFAPGTYPITIFKPGLTSSSTCEVFFFDMIPNHVNENKIVGGIRIKTITTNDGFGTPDVSNFSYTDNAGKSTGILYSRPTYIQYLRNDLIGEVGLGPGSYPNNNETPTGCLGKFGDNPNGVYLVSPGSIRPMATTQGGHIGYNEVKVSDPGKGFSIYRYYGSNYWDNISGDVVFRNLIFGSCSIENTPNYPEAPLPYDYKRGELKFEGNFNENGEMIKSIDYYPVFEENKLVTPCVISAPFANSWLTTFFDLKTSRKKQLTTIQHLMVPGQGNMEKTTINYFESPYHNQITRDISTDSKGESIETKYKYAFDYALSCDVVSDGHDQYLYDAAFYLFQYKAALLNSSANNSMYRRLQNHYYQENLHDRRVSYINYRRTNFTDPNSQFKTCFQNAKSFANSALKPLLELRDKGINVPIELTTWKNNALLNAVFNVYDFNGELTEMVYPIKMQKISLISPSVTFTPSAPNGNLFIKDSRYEDEAFYNFQGGKPVEVKGKDGVYTSYIWGYNNSVPIVKAEGVNYNILLSSFNNAGGNLSLLRTQSTLSSALISTYTYQVGVGMESEIDPKGKTFAYEYDPFGRLLQVKDQKGYIIKRYCYNYAGHPINCLNQTFTNTNQYSGSFTKSDCSLGFVGSVVTYTVPIGSVTSGLSELDANTLAEAKVQAEGQANANANGTCSQSTIYARLELETWYSGNYTYANVYIRFYSNPNCTVNDRINVSNLSLNYRKQSNNRDCYSPPNGNAIADGSSEILLEFSTLIDDPWGCSYSFNLLPGNGYTISF